MATPARPLPEPTDLDLLDIVILHTLIERQSPPIWIPPMPKFQSNALAQLAGGTDQDGIIRLYQARIDAWRTERSRSEGYDRINARIRERNAQIMASAMWAARSRTGTKIQPYPTEESARRAVHSNSVYGTLLRRDVPGGEWIDVVSIPLEEITATSRVKSALDA